MRVLIVDQFEDVFTHCQDLEQRTRFIRALCADSVTDGPRVVLGLRADHYGRCLAHPELVRAMHDGQLLIPPMSEKSLRAAVEQPAQESGSRLEAGLAELLLRDAREGGGRAPGSALPFLAHALRETWTRRSGATLTLAGYAATGGIWESVAHTAEEIHEELDAPGREVLRELLLSMVSLTGSGDEPVRRRIRLDELLDGRSEYRRRLAVQVRDRLARARLITIGQDSVQFSHEALLGGWPRLRRWIEEDRAGLVTRQQLADAADAWQAAGRDTEFCYRGTRLAAAVEWLGEERHERLLRPLDRYFVDASRAAELARQHRNRRRTRRLKQLLVGFAVALCLTLIATVIAVRQRDEALHRGALLASRTLAQQSDTLREANPALALQLALASYRTMPTQEARTSLLASAAAPFAEPVAHHAGAMTGVAYSPDGRTLAAPARTAACG